MEHYTALVQIVRGTFNYPLLRLIFLHPQALVPASASAWDKYISWIGGSFIANKWRWFCTLSCHEVRQKFMTHYVKHSGLKSQWSWVLISWAGGCLTWCGPVIIPGPGHLHSIHTISSNSKLSLLFWMDFAYPLSSNRKWICLKTHQNVLDIIPCIIVSQ